MAYVWPRTFRSGVLQVKKLVVLMLLCFPLNAMAQAATKKLVTIDGGGVFRAWLGCVYAYTSQGIPVRMAVEECVLTDELSIPESDVDVSGILGEGASVPTGVCAASSVDPTLAKEDGGIPKAYEDLANSLGLANELQAACAKGNASACLAGEMEKNEQARVVNEAKKNEAAKGGGKDGGTRRLAGDQLGACEAATTTIAECNRDGWKTEPCQMLLGKLQGCADPLIARTNPDEPDACGMEEVDPETIKRVTFLVCAKDKRPLGPDTNPCEPMGASGIAHVYRLPGKEENPLCSDPQALVLPEDCIHTIEVIDVGTDWEEELREFQAVFGGPVTVFPGHGGNPEPPAGCEVCAP